MEQAMLDGGLSESDMRDVAIGLVHGRPWVRTYLAQLDRRLDGGAAESDAEVRVGDALRAHGVDGVVRQHRTHLSGRGNVRFDLAIPDLKWSVEVDVFPTHEQTVGAAADAQRDLAAAGDGWVVRRMTRRQYESAFNRSIEWLVCDVRSLTVDPSPASTTGVTPHRSENVAPARPGISRRLPSTDRNEDQASRRP